MISTMLRLLPLWLFTPLRRGAVRLRRGSLGRSLCVLILKHASVAYRGRLGARLTEIRPLDAPQLSFLPTDSMVMDAVYWLGIQGYEGKVADVWGELCRHADAILEIGGNVGLFTVIGGTTTAGSYTVIEPVPDLVDVIKANLRRNGLTSVDVRQAAVIPAETAGIVRLNIPDEHRAAPVGAHLLEGVEVAGRSSMRVLAVDGLPIRALMAGKDLVKIDAEGIEAELLGAVRDLLLERRPSLLVEVLPEARKLGVFLAAIASEAGYVISIIPEYGSDRIVTVRPEAFSSELPQRFNSKDIVLSPAPLPFPQDSWPAETTNGSAVGHVG